MTLTAEPPSECDVAVVGGGIVGLTLARELLRRHPGLGLVLLEKEDRLATHQTTHSSGVVHAGIYYRPGSLKARLCVEGARDLYAYCEERGIPFERSGKLILALREEELTGLDELERRGRANGVPGLRRVSAAEIREIEPQAAGRAGLHSPETGVLDFALVAGRLAEDIQRAGGRLATGTQVNRVSEGAGRVALHHSKGALKARFAAFCAGGWATRLAAMAGVEADCRIVPFRGAYLRLRPERRDLVRSLIYPVPNPELPFLGAHLTRLIDGDVLLGPTALLAGAPDAYRLGRVSGRSLAQSAAWPGTWRMAGRLWRTGLAEGRRTVWRRSLVRELSGYVPALSPADVLPGPVGVRAQAVGRDGALLDDFRIERTERTLHVLNAPSPAATSALALAREIADRIEI